MIARDYHRVPLDRDVAPGEEWTRSIEVPHPREGAFLRVDLVAEGVAWFEAGGTDLPLSAHA